PLASSRGFDRNGLQQRIAAALNTQDIPSAGQRVVAPRPVLARRPTPVATQPECTVQAPFVAARIPCTR
ncbi:MAG: hypothetical protein AAGG72_07825, partial [Pseudomonadota bacterium]